MRNESKVIAEYRTFRTSHSFGRILLKIGLVRKARVSAVSGENRANSLNLNEFHKKSLGSAVLQAYEPMILKKKNVQRELLAYYK